jgi:hypothetical protein
MTDEEFLSAFESCVFPADKWHHREHIKMAYLYLSRSPFDEALARIRAGIQLLNASHHTPETLTRGYHETMTQAWARLVFASLCEYGAAESADSFYNQHPQLSQPKALRLFYSPERLMTAQAKAEFVEPDLAPLPKSSKPPPISNQHSVVDPLQAASSDR